MQLIGSEQLVICEKRVGQASPIPLAGGRPSAEPSTSLLGGPRSPARSPRRSERGDHSARGTVTISDASPVTRSSLRSPPLPSSLVPRHLGRGHPRPTPPSRRARYEPVRTANRASHGDSTNSRTPAMSCMNADQRTRSGSLPSWDYLDRTWCAVRHCSLGSARHASASPSGSSWRPSLTTASNMSGPVAVNGHVWSPGAWRARLDSSPSDRRGHPTTPATESAPAGCLR
jgi:hypothetical protein